jgi:hypothetical protein
MSRRRAKRTSIACASVFASGVDHCRSSESLDDHRTAYRAGLGLTTCGLAHRVALRSRLRGIALILKPLSKFHDVALETKKFGSYDHHRDP